jgi:hypothetical protein
MQNPLLSADAIFCFPIRDASLLISI